MPTVSASRAAPIPRCPPLLHPVKVKAASNDPTLRAQVSGNQTIHLRGLASNTGTKASAVTFQFDGRTISIPLSRGDTAADVQRKLEKQLPAGYAIREMPSLTYKYGAAFQIVRTKVPSDLPAIRQGFADAQKRGSPGGGLVNVNELRSIVAQAKRDGFTAAERQAVALSWAGLFDGSGFRATKEAQKEYRRLQEKFDLPIIPIR